MRICIIVLIMSIVTVGLYGAKRFQDNGNGMVTDNGTGLVWQKCGWGQSLPNCSGTAYTASWQEALQYCRNLTLAGKSWRLPSVNELKSIVDYTKYNPAIDTGYFPATQSAPGYWSSTTVVDIMYDVWEVTFQDGGVGWYNKTGSYCFVRCVADGP